MGLRGRSNLTDCLFYFITTSVVEHARVFSNYKCCNLLLKNILHYQDAYHFEILGYVIMPSHFHWIIKTDPKYGTVSDIMRDIKKYSAWDIMNELEKELDEEYKILFSSSAEGFEGQRRKFWMPRFDDEVIRNQKMFYTKLNYIHYNPVKAGMVHRPESYKYSSARNYLKDDHSVLFVETTYL